MAFTPSDSALALSTLLHALPAPQLDAPIAGLPAAVLGNVVSGVVGSLITLGGVLLSNLHSRRLKRDELRHDAEQRNREREMTLRRDVFLPAVEASFAMQYALGAIVNLNLPATEVSARYGAANATFVKIAAVGTQDTVSACQTLSNAMGRAWWELSLRRGGLDGLQVQLAEIDRNTAIHEGLRDSWIRVQQDLVAKGEKDTEIWQATRGHFTQHMNEINKAMTERSRIVGARQSAQRDMLKLMLTHLQALGPLFPSALFAMRREMQLPLDERAFLERYEKLRSEQMAMLKATFDPAPAGAATTETRA